MRSIIFTALLFASMSSNSVGVNNFSISEETKTYHHKLIDVPGAVLENFNSMFPGAKSVRWRFLESSYHPEHNQYIAFFRLDNVKRTARYAPDGTYLGGS